MSKTEQYITLKPISDKFKEVAMSISDDEIKSLIKNELKEQIKEQVEIGFDIANICNEWIENNIEFIEEQIKKCILNKFSN